MFKRGNLDTIHQQTALVLILKGGIGKSMHTFLLKQNENVIEGNAIPIVWLVLFDAGGQGDTGNAQQLHIHIAL